MSVGRSSLTSLEVPLEDSLTSSSSFLCCDLVLAIQQLSLQLRHFPSVESAGRNLSGMPRNKNSPFSETLATVSSLSLSNESYFAGPILYNGLLTTGIGSRRTFETVSAALESVAT